MNINSYTNNIQRAKGYNLYVGYYNTTSWQTRRVEWAILTSRRLQSSLRVPRWISLVVVASVLRHRCRIVATTLWIRNNHYYQYYLCDIGLDIYTCMIYLCRRFHDRCILRAHRQRDRTDITVSVSLVFQLYWIIGPCVCVSVCAPISMWRQRRTSTESTNDWRPEALCLFFLNEGEYWSASWGRRMVKLQSCKSVCGEKWSWKFGLITNVS